MSKKTTLTFGLIVGSMLAAVLFSTFTGCNKKNAPEFGTENQRLLKTDSAHHSAPDTSEIYLHVEKQQDLPAINQLALSVNVSGYLHFSDFESFETTIRSLMFQSDSAITVWEVAIGWESSLRGLYVTKELDEDEDDYQNDATRIPAREFEAILSDDYKFRIEDTLYTLDLSNEWLISVNLNNTNDRDTFDVFFGRGISSPCNNGTETDCEKLFSSTKKVVGEKWNMTGALYGSFGFRAINYEKNNRGNWKRKKAATIYIWLDHWHETCWANQAAYNNGALCYTLPTDDQKRWKMKNNAKYVEQILDFSFGIPTPSSGPFTTFCVEEFGRTHNWTHDFYEDCHNEAW